MTSRDSWCFEVGFVSFGVNLAVILMMALEVPVLMSLETPSFAHVQLLLGPL